VHQTESGVCPECHSEKLKEFGNMIECGHCGLKGDRSKMRFCEKVPMFSPVKKENVFDVSGQVYEDEWGNSWVLEGYSKGCGRPVVGEYCTSCRIFLPHPVDKPKRRGKRSAREVMDGKMSSTGDVYKEES
jgi:hypothetical protein